MAAKHPTYSVVVEMDNAKSIDWDEIGLGLKTLAARSPLFRRRAMHAQK
ncbi:hypothetical protein [Mesorhizobium sp.]|nr:hypothetical protein [Mesorhizobium sp.]